MSHDIVNVAAVLASDEGPRVEPERLAVIGDRISAAPDPRAGCEAGVAGARATVESHPALAEILSAGCDPALFRAWMLR